MKTGVEAQQGCGTKMKDSHERMNENVMEE